MAQTLLSQSISATPCLCLWLYLGNEKQMEILSLRPVLVANVSCLQSIRNLWMWSQEGWIVIKGRCAIILYSYGSKRNKDLGTKDSAFLREPRATHWAEDTFSCGDWAVKESLEGTKEMTGIELWRLRVCCRLHKKRKGKESEGGMEGRGN